MTANHLLASAAVDIPPVLLVPFGLLLLLIAVMPLTPAKAHHWWERYYPYVSIAFALVVGGYYALAVPAGRLTLQHTLHEYVSFIALIGSLFVVAGGIHLRVKGEATPMENVWFLLVGAVLANLIGTTGASVVLIRPWIRMNKIRISAYHIVFFIFLVSNVGGALTPIGDPPLFLGYLRGVPFFWLIEHLWLEWLVTVLMILAVFYGFDRRSFAHLPQPLQRNVAEHHDSFRIEGLPNLGLLAVIVAGVFLPAQYLIREVVMVAAALVSLMITPRELHERNHFNFGPVKEVGFLFIGIFTTMMPALNYLEAHGRELGVTKPAQYYYATGGLSAVLDNAPTYVNFLKLAETTFVTETPEEQAAGGDYDRRAVAILLETHSHIVVAISLGAVFFGAMTYIGNGPNFMVKSIAQSAGVHCPSFFGYLFRYSLPILLPILAIGAWLFL
ncbi:MAG: sodium:proton antiporter [Verrucomicrobia bacterium]|nr:sodium:proton antiporter [Verrucomicrobiota bacterium]